MEQSFVQTSKLTRMLLRNKNSIRIDINAVMRRIEADPNLFKDFEPETVKGIEIFN